MSAGQGHGGRSTLGLDQNVGGMLAYAFGLFSGIFLLIVERENRYIRFHAVQSTVFFLGVTVATLLLGSLPGGWLLTSLSTAAVTVIWIILMIKAFTGQRYKLPYVGEIAAQQFR